MVHLFRAVILAIAAFVLPVTTALAQSGGAFPHLSASQVSLLLQIHTFVTVRVEPGLPLPPSMRLDVQAHSDRLTALFGQYFPSYPVGFPEERITRDVQGHGRVVCRVAVAREGESAAYHNRCSLGNLYQNVIHAEDIRIVSAHALDRSIGESLEGLLPELAVRFFGARQTRIGEWVSGDQVQGRAAAERYGCLDCHAPACEITGAGRPVLARLDIVYLFDQLRRFRSGSRQHAPMQEIVAGMPDRHMRDLAAFYSRIECR